MKLKKSQFFSWITLLLATSVSAESTPAFIQNLKGCFKVSFRYFEEGHAPQIFEPIYEWVVPVSQDQETFLQHYGIVDGQAFKHWREDWTSSSDGKWNQKV